MEDQGVGKGVRERSSSRVRGGLEKAAEEVAVEKEITRGHSARSHTDHPY